MPILRIRIRAVMETWMLPELLIDGSLTPVPPPPSGLPTAVLARLNRCRIGLVVGIRTFQSAIFLALVASAAAQSDPPRTGGIFDEANRRQAQQQTDSMKHVKLPPGGTQQPLVPPTAAAQAQPAPARSQQIPK